MFDNQLTLSSESIARNLLFWGLIGTGVGLFMAKYNKTKQINHEKKKFLFRLREKLPALFDFHVINYDNINNYIESNSDLIISIILNELLMSKRDDNLLY